MVVYTYTYKCINSGVCMFKCTCVYHIKSSYSSICYIQFSFEVSIVIFLYICVCFYTCKGVVLFVLNTHSYNKLLTETDVVIVEGSNVTLVFLFIKMFPFYFINFFLFSSFLLLFKVMIFNIFFFLIFVKRFNVACNLNTT